MGVAGHPLAQTPNLDRLAARGTRFTSAYTTSPICVPARAAFATGKYPHQIGYWDNADRLRRRGAELAPPAAQPRPPGGLDRQAALPRPARGRSRLLGGAAADARRRRHRRRKGAGSRGHPAPQWLRQARQARRAGRVALYAIRPRHRRAGAGLAARGSAPASGQALGAFRVVRLPAFPARRAAGVLRPLPARARFRCRSSTWPASAPSIPTCATTPPASPTTPASAATTTRCAAPSPAISGWSASWTITSARCLRALETPGWRATRASSTPATMATTSARAGCGASRPCTRSRPACRSSSPGPASPRAQRCSTPASHVDLFPFFLECAGEPAADRRLPRHLSARARRRRARGSSRTERVPRHRLDRRRHHAAQGPLEVRALRALPAAAVRPRAGSRGAGRPRGRSGLSRVLAGLQAELRRFCDPDEVDARAKRRQAELLARYGGREAALARGDLNYTPAPGQPPDMN